MTWMWSCAVLATVVGAAALTPSELATSVTSSDKIDHLLAFCALSATGLLARAPGLINAMRVATLTLAYGALIELLQTRIPGRFGDPQDAVADGIGIAIGVTLVTGLRWLYRTKVR